MRTPSSPTTPAADPVPAHPSENEPRVDDAPHSGVVVSGENGPDGRKAFYIHIEAKPGREEDVVRMLRDIHGCILDEPATGPWFAFRYSQTVFGIFEAFPDRDGRDAHVAGGGGDVFRDVERMNAILALPAHVHRVDVLLHKFEPGRSSAEGPAD